MDRQILLASQSISGLQERVAQFAATASPQPKLAILLTQIARHHGLQANGAQIDALLAGSACYEPRLMAQAALLAGLLLDERAVPLTRLTAADCPALVVGAAGELCMAEAIRTGDAAAFALLREPDGNVRTVTEAAARDHAAFRITPFADSDEGGTNKGFLTGVIHGAGPLYLQVIAATIAINLLALALPLYTMNIYDRVLPNNAIDTLIALSAGALLATAFDFILKTLRGLLTDKASQKIDVRLANRLYARMLGAKLRTRQASTGTQANTLREYETLREMFSSATLTVIGDIPFALLFLAVMAVIAGPLALVALIAVPIIIAANFAVNWPLAKLQDKAFRDTAIKSTVIVETLNGLETIKAMGAEHWAAQRYEKTVAEHLRVSFWSRLWSMLGLNLVMSGQAIATLATVILGCLLVAKGEMTGGALMASMMLIGRVLAPFAQIASIAGKIHSARLAWRAVRDMAAAPQERTGDRAWIALPAEPAGISVEDVSFSYDPQMPPALKNISFSIRPGERVGFIGGSGSGKSTLLKLLLKLHEPDSGRILLGGLALSDIDPVMLRQSAGYCGQNPQLFQGTLRQNLSLHRPVATDSDILAAARITGAMNWIGRLPRGLDTQLLENGAGLSGGQRQSIALTRALIQAPAMLLLDEPTSDMDGRMEAHVVQQLKNAIGTRTLLLVTHRPALLDLVDRLVVFDHGRIMADGPKAEVLKQLQAQAEKAA